MAEKEKNSTELYFPLIIFNCLLAKLKDFNLHFPILSINASKIRLSSVFVNDIDQLGQHEIENSYMLLVNKIATMSVADMVLSSFILSVSLCFQHFVTFSLMGNVICVQAEYLLPRNSVQLAKY